MRAATIEPAKPLDTDVRDGRTFARDSIDLSSVLRARGTHRYRCILMHFQRESRACGLYSLR